MPSESLAPPYSYSPAYLPFTVSTFQPSTGFTAVAITPSGICTRNFVVGEPAQPCGTTNTARYSLPTVDCLPSRKTCALAGDAERNTDMRISLLFRDIFGLSLFGYHPGGIPDHPGQIKDSLP